MGHSWINLNGLGSREGKMKKNQRYEGKDIVVHFDASRCIHVGNCVRGLPGVFKANVEGAWIEPDAADAADLAALIRTCPSGALSYERSGEAEEELASAANRITIEADGPLRIHASYYLNGKKSNGFRATLCRCGASKNKPYCDNAHKVCGFRDAGTLPAADLADIDTNGTLDITALKDGPLLVNGGCELCNAHGEIGVRSEKLALCRCGASKNKPYCDGSHATINFKAD